MEIANLASSRYGEASSFVLFCLIIILGHDMPRYSFRVCQGAFLDASGEGFDLVDRDAAWMEMILVGADLVGSVTRKLKQNSEWQIELLDESRTPLFRIRVVAETLDEAGGASDAG